MSAVLDIPHLITDLGSGRYAARRQAALAFLSLGQGAVEPLLNMLQFGPPRAKMEAARTLGDLGDSRAVSDLLQAMTSDDWRLAARAAHALGRIHNSRAAFALIIALGHPAGDVRYEAAMALSRLHIPTLRVYLEARLELEQGMTSWGIPVVEGVRRALDVMPVGA